MEAKRLAGLEPVQRRWYCPRLPPGHTAALLSVSLEKRTELPFGKVGRDRGLLDFCLEIFAIREAGKVLSHGCFSLLTSEVGRFCNFQSRLVELLPWNAMSPEASRIMVPALGEMTGQHSEIPSVTDYNNLIRMSAPRVQKMK